MAMARQYTQLVVALLALASASAVDDNKRRTSAREISSAFQDFLTVKELYGELYAQSTSEDDDAPGGPKDYPQTEPFHFTPEDQVGKPYRVCLLCFSFAI